MHVSLVVAISNDGFIARSETDRSFDWTTAEDKAFFIQKLRETEVVIMGQTTFNTFTRYPKGKTYVILTRHPEKFVNPKPAIINTIPTNATPIEIIGDLKKKGFEKIMIAGGSRTYTEFAKAGMVDSYLITVEEAIDLEQGIPLFSDDTIWDQMKLVSITPLAPKTKLFVYENFITSR